jgi:hypothetical protein
MQHAPDSIARNGLSFPTPISQNNSLTISKSSSESDSSALELFTFFADEELRQEAAFFYNRNNILLL